MIKFSQKGLVGFKILLMGLVQRKDRVDVVLQEGGLTHFFIGFLVVEEDTLLINRDRVSQILFISIIL